MEVPTISGWMKIFGFVGIYVALLWGGHWAWAAAYCLALTCLYTDWRKTFWE